MMSDWMKEARAKDRELDQSTKKNSYKERLHQAGESARKNGLAPKPVQTAAKVQTANTETKPVQMSKPANNYLLSDNLKTAGENMKNASNAGQFTNAELFKNGEFANAAVKNLRANGQTEAADNLKSQLDALERERHIAELKAKQAEKSVQQIPIPKPIFPQSSTSQFASPGVKEIGDNLITRYNAQTMQNYLSSREYAHKQETARKRAQTAADSIYKEMKEYIANPNVNALDDPKILDYRNRYHAALMESVPNETQQWETEQCLDILATGGESLMNVIRNLAEERERTYSRKPTTSVGVDAANDYFNRYNQLKKKYGDVLDDWLTYADHVRNGEIAEGKLADWQQFGRDKSDFATWNTSVVAGLGSYAGYIDAWGQKLTNAITGKDYPIDYNTPAQMPAKISQAIRNGATEDKNGFGRFLYNSTASIADSTIPLAFGGPGKAILALSGATNYMQAAAERGVPDNQALFIGGVCGVADMAIEKLGFDRIFGAKSAGTLADDIIGVFDNAGLDALGEGATTIVTTAADALFAGDKSEINTEIKNYMEEGYSYNEAVNLARKSWVNGLALDMAGGYFSGGVLSGGKVGFNAATGKYNTNRPVTISQQPFVQTPEQQVAKDFGDFGSKENASADEPKRVGRATVLKNPYNGETPTYIMPQSRDIPTIQSSGVQTAVDSIANAKIKAAQEGKGFKGKLTEFWETVFKDRGGERKVRVEGLSFRDMPYDVTLYKSLVGKLISDKNLSAEKLAVLDVLDSVIQNSEYVGSSRYIPKNNKQKHTIRFDHFETPISIETQNNGETVSTEYVVLFDVEVFPSENNYRTHKIINEMDLVPSRRTDTGTGLPQGDRTQDPSNISIPNSDASVNMEDLDELDEATFERLFLEGFRRDGHEAEINVLTDGDKNGNVLSSENEDFDIGRSLGAKAKNYEIELPDGEIVHLTEGSRVTNVETIAGKGRNRLIDEIDGLLEKFSKTSEFEWQKKKGVGFIDYDGESYRVDLHWYEEPSVGKVKWKVKPDKDGNWFYED